MSDFASVGAILRPNLTTKAASTAVVFRLQKGEIDQESSKHTAQSEKRESSTSKREKGLVEKKNNKKRLVSLTGESARLTSRFCGYGVMPEPLTVL
ncbi:hypothetical protein [Kosakonia radicincitans]|uniref:hypothetical protein n=1 Tax=Kosakonia radicincitans TaxID=283686 RepID=UPI00178C6D32|nr:hypothetical protein [Kosakonia radicincitans]